MTVGTDKILENKLMEQMTKVQDNPANSQIQQKVMTDAIQGQSSPQQQAMQLLTTAPNLNQTQQIAQQQIKQGYVDVKI